MSDVLCNEMDSWINSLRLEIRKHKPELLNLFETYAGEALFGRTFIDSDLEKLPINARILEVGAGSLILSCQLVREGYIVTALEPIGEGFSYFEELRSIVLGQAVLFGYEPRLLTIVAEELYEPSQYDFAFSINVMEHVKDVGVVIENVVEALSPIGYYRFTCPNYLFPYEPHFNIPTLFSKKLTEWVLHNKIFGSKKILDPSGTWQSLNWINVVQVRNIVNQLKGIKITFNRNLLVSTFERIGTDQNFAGRRSPIVRKLILILVQLRLHFLLRFMPALFQPIMDCRLLKERNLLEL
jgi:2-polyprenyl-3-methyl-5-hydroxy-6-metoxy-1,4-benzoquinol methylase